MCTGTLRLILTVGSSDDVISAKKSGRLCSSPPCTGGGGREKSSSFQWPFLYSPLIPCFLHRRCRKCGFGHFAPKFTSMYFQNSPNPLSGWGGAAAFPPSERCHLVKICAAQRKKRSSGIILYKGPCSPSSTHPFPARQIFSGAWGEARCAVCCVLSCTLPMGARSASVKTSFFFLSFKKKHPQIFKSFCSGAVDYTWNS